MSHLEMPIRRYLQGEFNATVNESKEDPFEAFVRLQLALAKRAIPYDTYAQATITSGGHARNPDLEWIDIVKKNVAYAQNMAENLYGSGQLDPRRTIEASTLGLVEHWKESDYMTFWLTTLSQPAFVGNGAANRVDAFRKRFTLELGQHDIDLDTFNDYKKSAPDRAPYYFKLAGSFADTVEGTEYTPVERLVAVSETAGSLGASTERFFAKRLGTRIFGLAVGQFGQQTLPGDFENPLLVSDTRKIVEFGGQIFDPREKTRVIIVPTD